MFFFAVGALFALPALIVPRLRRRLRALREFGAPSAFILLLDPG
jgi:hypothetical protein